MNGHTSDSPCPECKAWVDEQLRRATPVSIEATTKLKALLVPPPTVAG